MVDTNIFIFREDFVVLPEKLQALLQLFERPEIQIVVHPLSVMELQKDIDIQRRSVVLSKVRVYSTIEDPPLVQNDAAFMKMIGNVHDENELVDDNLLYSIFRDSADFLVTEDKEIQHKAKRLGLSHRVFSVVQALDYFKERLRIYQPASPPALLEISIHSLSYDDPIFDSLKIEYANTEVPFAEWWTKISRQGRKAWTFFRKDGRIGAILIYKIENEAVPSNPHLPAKRRLKICTLKVAPTESGQRIGELFIKMSAEYATKNALNEIYLTHFARPNDELIQLIEEFGFLSNGKLGEQELYLKETIPKGPWASPFDVSKKFYPSFYDGELVNKFIVPIQPQFHDRLFTDYSRRQPTIPEYSGGLIVEGNTIRKAYLSHSKIHGMRQGDIILFYRSKDEKSLVTLGIVEEVTHTQNTERISNLVAKRTVYDRAEIKRFASKPTKIILFREHLHMKQPLELNYLVKNGILPSAPRSIVKISHPSYLKIKEAARIDKRFTVDKADVRYGNTSRKEEVRI